jgi:TonB family protein
MLQLAAPPDRPRPALLASLGLHVVAASAFGFGPLLAFPAAPGWRGEVWVTSQPDLSQLRDVKTVDLRDRAPKPAVSRGAAGGPPAARREGPPAEPLPAAVQPGSMLDHLPSASDSEPAGYPGVSGGVDDGADGPVGDPGGSGDGDGPIDIRSGGVPPDVVLPVPLETPAPRYPDPARLVHAMGTVVLAATISTDGRVVEVEVESGANPLLVRAAVETVSRWRYVPARFGSRPVAVILRVTLTFRLV